MTQQQCEQSVESLTHLKLLSFNIQVGIDTHRYSDYIRKSWRHILPHAGRHHNLTRVAQLVKDYDLVALQEVDAGSLRSSFVNQVEFIAKRAGFPHWHVQRNRNLANITAHANGLLAKVPAEMVIDHSLPGFVPGRGAMQISFGSSQQNLVVVVAHLALGRKAQEKQLRYIAESLSDDEHFVIMGDMNCEPEWLLKRLESHGLKAQASGCLSPTYPSWAPKRCFDQILISPSLNVTKVEVLPEIISDHLPIAVEIKLPHLLASEIYQRHEQQITVSGYR